MQEKQSRSRTPYRGSRTMKELSRINKQLDLLEQVTIYEKGALAGDFGLKTSLRASHRDSEWISRRMQLQAQKRLVEQELIQLTELGERIKIELTSNGRSALLKQSILECEQELPSGEYCLVSYDIPEELRAIRNQFRNLLKQAGFEMVHLSLWRSTKDIIDTAQDYVKQLGVSQWVSISRVIS